MYATHPTEPIFAMLHNAKEERYHPILFLWSPPPSGGPRYKSKTHHTLGFPTRQEAIEHVTNELAAWVQKNYGTKPALCFEKDFFWDGEDIPAMVVFFMRRASDGEVVPAW